MTTHEKIEEQITEFIEIFVSDNQERAKLNLTDLLDTAVREARIDELQRTAVNPYYPGGPSKEDAVVYVKQIRNRIQQLTGGKK